MASYQNSAGNKGIASQYGQWRYFNSSIQALDKGKAARLNTRVLDAPPKVADNYAEALGKLVDIGLAGFKAYQKNAYDLADRYIDRYGLQAYNKAIVDNEIPIQDNPVAMQRIKYRTGQILSGIEETDFNNRIARGEFVGKSPYEVEVAMIDSKISAPSEAAQYIPYDTEDDYFFKEGFWAESERQREASYVRNAQVTNQRYKEESARQVSALVGKLIDDGNTPDSVFAGIEDFENTQGVYFSPSEKTELYTSIFTRASTKPWGRSYIDYLADQKIPGSDMTFRDYYGDDYIRTLQTKADNIKFEADGKEYYAFKTNVDSLKTAPDGIPKLRGLLAEELKKNGNLKTKRTDLLYGAIDDAEKNQKTLLKSAEAENERTLTLASYIDYYRDKALGNTSETEESAIFRLKGDANTRKLAQQFVVGEVLNSGDTVRINTMLNNIVSNGAPSELRTFTAEQFKNAFTKTTSAVEKFVNKGVLPTSADQDMVPFTDAKGNNLGYVPKNLASFVEVYNMNPSAVADLVSNDKGFKDDMDLINMGMDMGYNPIEILGRKQAFIDNNEAMKDATGTTEQKFNTLVRMSEIRGFEEDRIPKAQFARVNAALDGIVLARAHKLSLVTNERMGKCVSAAKEQVEAELAGINTFVVPRSLLLKDFAGITVDSDTVVDIANEVFVDIAKTAPGVKLPKDYDASYYDAANNTIHVIDISGNPRGDIPINVFTKKIREAFDKRNIER